MTMSNTTTPTTSAAPSTADLDAARLLLDRLGISPADLMASTGREQRAPAPTFASTSPPSPPRCPRAPAAST
jgi:integrase/recombinase XerC